MEILYKRIKEKNEGMNLKVLLLQVSLIVLQQCVFV